MKPMPTGVPMKDEWARYYEMLITDRAKVDFLLMLKERRDRYGDKEAGKTFSEKAERWIKEAFKA